MSRSPLRIRVPGRIAVSLRRLSIHRIRLLLTVSTIAVAAALMVSASGLAGSIRGSTAKTARALAGNSDLEVAALSDGGFAADLADEVLAVEGVDVAAPILRSPVVINGVGALLVGVTPQALSLFPLNDATITDGGSGDLTVAEPLAGELGVVPGDAVVVAGADGARSSVVRSVISGGGIANAGAGAVAVSELRTAQVLAGRPGRADSVMVRFADDANPAALRSRIAEVVGGRASVIDPGDSLRGAETALAGVNQALGAMAGLTLLVSAFVVFNMMSMSALERRRELALLRALGASRSSVVAQFLIEAAIIGLLAAVPGSVLGLFGARATVGALPAGVESTLGTKLEFLLPTWAVPVAIFGSVLTAVAASAMPALRAATTPPVEALRSEATSGGVESRTSQTVLVATVIGVVSLGLGIAIATVGDAALAGPAAALSVLGAVAVLYAGLGGATFLATTVARWFGAPGQLAADGLQRSPRQLWATMTTVVLGVAMTLAIGEVSANLRSAAADTFVPLEKIDLLVQATPPDELPIGVGLPPEVQTALATIPGVTRSMPGRFSFSVVNGERLLVQGVDPETNSALISLAGDNARKALAQGKSMVVSTQYSSRLGLHVGDLVTIDTPAGPRSVEIAGTAPSFLWPNGVLGIDFGRFVEWFGSPGPTYIELVLADDADPNVVVDLIEQIPSDVPLHVFDGPTLIDAGLKNIEQVQVLLLSFQWIVVIAAALAILNTVVISLMERRRQFGMLRAFGMTRRSLVRSVLAETEAVVIVGGVFGVALGLLQHRLLVRLAESSGFPTNYGIAVVPAVVAVLAAVVMAFVGAFLPIRRVSRDSIVEAIGYE